jgi:hypothetical protein
MQEALLLLVQNLDVQLETAYYSDVAPELTSPLQKNDYIYIFFD